MADRKFGSSDRGKRPFSPKREGGSSAGSSRSGDRPKRDWKEKGEGGGDRKSFKAKFSRKGSGGTSEDKPARSAGGYGARKKEGDFSSAPRKRFSDRSGDDKKGGYARKSGPGSYTRGESKPRFGKGKEEGGSGDSGFARKKFGDRAQGDKKGGFSKGLGKGFDKPFKKQSEEESFSKPDYAANPAFSPRKKYFKGKEEGEGGGERKRSFDKDKVTPHRGRSKSFGAPSFGRPKKFSSAKTRDVMTEKPKDGLIRLNKYISNSGVCSRREADELIKMGLISVNGQVITEMGFKVKPTDDVRHEAKRLTAEKPVYVLLNKPKGFITTTDDPQERKTVMHLIGNAVKERIYPVGRLDRNTTGLLLLTNDGELADRLTHPSYKAKKIYRVELDKDLTKADFDKILEGIRFEEGKAIVDDLAYVDNEKNIVGIEIHIGWNRIVRRIFEALGYEVVKLDRVVYAGLDKKNIGRGEWRFLKQDEVTKLKHFK
jgi:23S rRNA pseudouridine2605 synthase